MTRPRLFRRDFFISVDPALAIVCGWLVVAVAAAVPLGSATVNVLGALLLIAFLAAGGFAERWKVWRSHPFALITILLFAVIFLGVSYSNAPLDEIRRALTKYARLLYAPIVIAVLFDSRWRRRALLAWMASMLLTLALSYMHALWAFPLARATRELAQDDHYIFKHHITQNVMMSLFVVAAFAEAWRVRMDVQLRKRFWFCVIVALAAILNVLFLVHGRTGYITLFANLMALAVVAVFAVRDRRVAAAAAGLIVAVALVASMSDSVHQRLSMAVSEVESSHEQGIKTSIGQRMEYASKSLDLVLARPILGWGTGSYAQEYCRIAKSAEWCRVGAYNPHNQFLFIAVQFGLLGVVMLVAWFVAAAIAMRRVPLYKRFTGFALLSTLVIHSLLDSPLYIVTEGTWYPLMLGILLAGAYGESRPRAEDSTASTDGQSG